MSKHRPYRTIAQVGTVLLVAVLAGCATNVPAPTHQTLSPAPPLPRKDATVYHIMPSASQLRIRVYRGGLLGDLGHNHVIVTSDIQGNIYLHPKISQSGFKLTIPLKSLKVDPAQARQQEGSDFESTVSDDDRAGTRKNMLGKAVLDVAQYPIMTLRSIKIQGPPWYPRITVRITLHDVSRDYIVPTAIVRGDNRVTAIGGLTLKQSDFGITPFSVLAGALKVQDKIRVSFRFVATP